MEVLNNIIKKTIDMYEISDIKEYVFLIHLNKIILENRRKRMFVKYKKRIDFTKSYEYSKAFLNSITSEYGDYLEKRKNEGVFNFDYNGLLDYSSSDIINGIKIINFSVYNNISDSYAITHEIIHDMSADEEYCLTRSLFCEVPSLLSEMLQSDYFERNGKPKDYLLNGINTINYLQEKAINIDFELKLIMCFLDNGYVNKEELLDILKYYKKEDKITILYHIENILLDNELKFDFNQRYIIGYLFATYMHDRILKTNKYDEFVDINDSLNDYSIEQLLSYLDLDYSDYMYFDLTKNCYKKLEEGYVKYLKRI